MDKDNPHKAPKNSIYGIYFSLGAIIFAVFALVFDPGPLLPPFPDKFESIDCDTIQYVSYSLENQTLNITFVTNDPVEYPIAYLPYFMKIYAKSSINKFNFERTHFHNLTKNGNFINLLITMPATGQFHLLFECLGDVFATDQVTITNSFSDITKSSSLSIDPVDDIAAFDDICYINDSIFFFTNIPSSFNSIDFSNHSIPFSIYPYKFHQYLEYRNFTQIMETSFVLSKIETGWWQSILFTLNPLAESIRVHSETEKFNFFYDGQIPKGSVELLKRFQAKKNTKISKEDCYKRLVFTGTKSGMDLTKENEIRTALQKNFTQLRTFYVENKKKDPKRIILPTCLSHLEKDVTSVCPDCSIFALGPRLDINTVADQVSKGSILIGNHLNNLVHAVWLDPNNTAVIDVSPSDDQVCIKYAKEFIEHLNISYYNVLDDKYKTKNCRYTTLSCMKMPPIEAEEPRFYIVVFCIISFY